MDNGTAKRCKLITCSVPVPSGRLKMREWKTRDSQKFKSENCGSLKCRTNIQGWKFRDWKMQNQNAKKWKMRDRP